MIPVIEAVVWPNFPDPAGMVSQKDGVVSMPLAYWLKITDFVLDVEAIKESILAAKYIDADEK